MDWLERLNRGPGRIDLGGATAEVLQWAYAPHLFDEVSALLRSLADSSVVVAPDDENRVAALWQALRTVDRVRLIVFR